MGGARTLPIEELSKTFVSPLPSEVYAALLERLRQGGVGLFPTDTVYGLGCRADSSEGTRRIFDVKGRDYAKTLPILIGDWGQFEEYAAAIRPAFRKRLREVWPGGLTAVLPASQSEIPLSSDCLRDGTIAVRMPAHEGLCRLIRDSGIPLAATSANLSGEGEHLRLKEIASAVRGRVDWEWDEEIPAVEIRPSTVVDLTGETPIVLRNGGVVF